MRLITYTLILLAVSFSVGRTQQNTASPSISLSVQNFLHQPISYKYKGSNLPLYIVSNLNYIQLRASILSSENLASLSFNPQVNSKLPAVLEITVDDIGNRCRLKPEQLLIADSNYSVSMDNQYGDAEIELPLSKEEIDDKTNDFITRAKFTSKRTDANKLAINYIDANRPFAVKYLEQGYLQNRVGLFEINGKLLLTDSLGNTTAYAATPILIKVEYKGDFLDKLLGKKTCDH